MQGSVAAIARLRTASAASPELPFRERHLQNLLVLDRAVSKISVFAEQLAVIWGDIETCIQDSRRIQDGH
jgi:hypothetical protein